MGPTPEQLLHNKRVKQLRKDLGKAYVAKKEGRSFRDYYKAVGLDKKDPEVKRRIELFYKTITWL